MPALLTTHPQAKAISVCNQCSEKVIGRGLCRKHYSAWYRSQPGYRERFRSYYAGYRRLATSRIRKNINCRVWYLLDDSLRQWHVEYRRAYRKTPRGKANAVHNSGLQRAKSKRTDITTDYLLELWDKTTVCEVCNAPLGLDRSIDHIVPLIIGGEHVKSNVRYIHRRCNSKRPKDGSDLPKT